MIDLVYIRIESLLSWHIHSSIHVLYLLSCAHLVFGYSALFSRFLILVGKLAKLSSGLSFFVGGYYCTR